jgi:hypothetical protein
MPQEYRKEKAATKEAGAKAEKIRKAVEEAKAKRALEDAEAQKAIDQNYDIITQADIDLVGQQVDAGSNSLFSWFSGGSK